MINTTHWELVRECDFVAARAFDGFRPGDDVPNIGKNMRHLYELNKITVKPRPIEEPIKKRKKKEGK